MLLLLLLPSFVNALTSWINFVTSWLFWKVLKKTRARFISFLDILETCSVAWRWIYFTWSYNAYRGYIHIRLKIVSYLWALSTMHSIWERKIERERVRERGRRNKEEKLILSECVKNTLNCLWCSSQALYCTHTHTHIQPTSLELNYECDMWMMAKALPNTFIYQHH